MDLVAQLVVWLNVVANLLGEWLLAPVAYLPGWVSVTLVSAATGVLFLIAFKYTSNQAAIKRVKNDITANLLSLKLFKESALVAVNAQGRVLLGAYWLLIFALMPMLVMMAPAVLILSQLALWYESRPLRPGDGAVVTLKLNGAAESAWPNVRLEPLDAIETTVGPVRVQSKREICWNIKARATGYQQMVFHVGDQSTEKELAIGAGFMRVSTTRPGWKWSDALLNPAERPLGPDSAIQSIEIDYPERTWWSFGSGFWVIYWFVVSMVAGLCFRRLLNVNI
jgi:hypothetical protein